MNIQDLQQISRNNELIKQLLKPTQKELFDKIVKYVKKQIPDIDQQLYEDQYTKTKKFVDNLSLLDSFDKDPRMMQQSGLIQQNNQAQETLQQLQKQIQFVSRQNDDLKNQIKKLKEQNQQLQNKISEQQQIQQQMDNVADFDQIQSIQEIIQLQQQKLIAFHEQQQQHNQLDQNQYQNLLNDLVNLCQKVIQENYSTRLNTSYQKRIEEFNSIIRQLKSEEFCNQNKMQPKMNQIQRSQIRQTNQNYQNINNQMSVNSTFTQDSIASLNSISKQVEKIARTIRYPCVTLTKVNEYQYIVDKTNVLIQVDRTKLGTIVVTHEGNTRLNNIPLVSYLQGVKQGRKFTGISGKQ